MTKVDHFLLTVSNVIEKVGEMVVWEPLSEVRRQQEELVGVVRLESSAHGVYFDARTPVSC